jgi:hypothetical protein
LRLRFGSGFKNGHYLDRTARTILAHPPVYSSAQEVFVRYNNRNDASEVKEAVSVKNLLPAKLVKDKLAMIIKGDGVGTVVHIRKIDKQSGSVHVCKPKDRRTRLQTCCWEVSCDRICLLDS